MSLSPLFAVAGVVTWSFGEYALHNWIGHLTKGRTAFSREHLAHHANSHYFTPTSRKVATAAMVLSAITAALALVLGVVNALWFSTGFTVMYTTYEVIHRRTHTHAPRGWYSRWARRHHFLHHYTSPKMNHGVTSPIWDIVFRTYQRPALVRVPEKHAPAWLVDPTTGEVKAEYAGDYQITRRKRSHQPPAISHQPSAVSHQPSATALPAEC